MDALEKFLAGLFKSLPSLPANVKTVLVKVAPWVNIIILVFALPMVFAALGLSMFAGSMMAYGYYSYGPIAILLH